MIVGFSKEGWEDYCYWQECDKKKLRRINRLIADILRNPHDENGLGKPEKLKANLQGYYSRRIDAEHRLVYTIKNGMLIIVQCRYHY